MGFSEGDIGVLPPLGVFDPLGLIETRDMRRYEIMEIKHGRAAMLGFLHVIAIEAGIRVPGYLSTSMDLKFSDVPAGCFATVCGCATTTRRPRPSGSTLSARTAAPPCSASPAASS